MPLRYKALIHALAIFSIKRLQAYWCRKCWPKILLRHDEEDVKWIPKGRKLSV